MASVISHIQGPMLTAMRALPVLIVFEHLITTDREIDLFWKHNFSGAAAIFLTNRYLILVNSAIRLVVIFDRFVSTEVSPADQYAVDSISADIFVPP